MPGPLVLIDVETDQGVTGHAYIFAYSKLTLKPLVHLIEEIGRELYRQAGRALRFDGGDGRKIPPARLAGSRRHGGVRPRHGLLGCARPDGRQSPSSNCSAARQKPIKAYDSYGVVDPTADERRCAARSNRGFAASRSRAATAMPPTTNGVVKGVRALLGPDCRADDRLQPVARSR
jgi:mandelate racemase